MFINSNQINESATLQINSIANNKKNLGIKVYNFSVGEPVMNNHSLIIRNIDDYLQNNIANYPSSYGIKVLLDLVVSWMNTVYGCSYTKDEAMITCGGKYGLSLSLQAILDKGDEVVIISPYWVSYPEMIKIYGGKPIIYETYEEDNWSIDIEKFGKIINERTKAIIINNGANPTGHLYNKDELNAILKISQDKGIYLISDEVYSGLVYDGNRYISLGEIAQKRDRLIIIQSCSKNFAMTGWRVGIVFSTPEIIRCLSILQSQSITNTSIVSQWAACEAFKNAEVITNEVRMIIEKRRNIFVETFNKIFPGQILPPMSGLYCFVNINKFGIVGISADQLAVDLIDKANVAITPGSGFGKNNYIRFSFGINDDDKRDGLMAMKKYLNP